MSELEFGPHPHTHTHTHTHTQAVITEMFTGECLYDQEAREAIVQQLFPSSIYAQLKDEVNVSTVGSLSLPYGVIMVMVSP